MVLESTMVLVDNSEYMRNGDFIPTRLQAQQDAVNLICHSKTRSNPENNVGVMTMADTKVLATLTTDIGKILGIIHRMEPKGMINFITGVKVAHLVLKHRQGRNHRMRIIIFVASPILQEDKEIVQIAKKLKKEKVNVDIINFGEDVVNEDKLNLFVTTVNGKEGCSSHMVTVPPGTIISDSLLTSPIIVGEDGSGAIPGLGAPSSEFEFGFDPSTDPELAMALRISMEEQRQRQGDEAQKPAEGTVTADADTKEKAAAGSEEALLEQALAMSMDQPMESEEGEDGGGPGPAPPSQDVSAMTEEEQIALAMQMSMQGDLTNPSGGSEAMDTSAPAAEAKSEEPVEDFSEVLSDPAFLQSVLESLPGVDTSSETVRSAMGTLTQQAKKAGDTKKGTRTSSSSDPDKDKKDEGSQ